MPFIFIFDLIFDCHKARGGGGGKAFVALPLRKKRGEGGGGALAIKKKKTFFEHIYRKKIWSKSRNAEIIKCFKKYYILLVKNKVCMKR